MINLNEKYVLGSPTVIFTGNLDVNAGVRLGDGITSNVLIDATTPSTSTNTGALVVLGGAAIQGNLNVGQTVFGNISTNTVILSAGSVVSQANISHWRITDQALSVSAEDSSPQGIWFKPDGTKMYIAGFTGTDIVEYSLSTPWDISTNSATTSYALSFAPYDLYITSDGLTVYIVETTTPAVRSYTTGTPWDFSSLSTGPILDLTGFETTATGIDFKPDLSRVYVCGSGDDEINEFALSETGNLATATHTQAFSLAAQDSGPQGIRFNSDGTRLYMIGSTGDDINQFDLSTAWDISTLVYSGRSGSFETHEATLTGLYFRANTTQAWVVGSSGDTVRELDVSGIGIGLIASSTYLPGQLRVGTELDVEGNILVNRELSVHGATSLLSTLAVSSTLTASGTFTASGTSATLGSSTAAATYNVGSGATVSGSTKTVNVGTSGASGSTTNINIGPTAGAGTAVVNCNLTVSGTTQVAEIVEVITDVTQSTNAVTLDFATGGIFYRTSTNFSANFTVNITNAPTTDGRTFTVTLFQTQGATGYRPATLTVNAGAVTIKWLESFTPIPTSTNGKVDIFTFTLVRRSGTYECFATMAANFG